MGLLLTTAGCPGSLGEDEKLTFNELFGNGGGAGNPGTGGNGGGAGGAGGSGGGSCTIADFDGKAFLVTKCTSCHSPAGIGDTNNFAGLDLETDTAEDPLIGRLLDQPAVEATCTAEKLINSTDATKSVMYQVLLPNPMCGTMPGPEQMPQGPKLSQAQVDCLLQWIKDEIAGG